MPSLNASSVSPEKQCDALAGYAGLPVLAFNDGCHLWAAGESLTVGNAEILNRVAPIGIRVRFCTGWSLHAGLGCNTPHKPYLSTVHSGICRPLAKIWMGALAGVNG